MEFSKKLKELRIENGLTQDQLALKCNLSHGCIAMLEVGKRVPTGTTLIALADFFQCSVDYLLSREDDFGNITIQTEGLQLTKEEENLLNDFRTLPRPERAQATEYIHYLADKRGIKNKHA